MTGNKTEVGEHIMLENRRSRRNFLETAGPVAAVLPLFNRSLKAGHNAVAPLDESFFIAPSELTLMFEYTASERVLSFHKFTGKPQDWKKRCKAKLTELLGLAQPSPGTVRELRRTKYQGVEIRALVMSISPQLSLPAYLLMPASDSDRRSAVMAIHGHGRVEPVIGSQDDYHRSFGLELAKAGHVVLCPALRGFGSLQNMSLHREGFWLDYWSGARGRQFTLVTEGFLYGKTLIGETVEDLLRWEHWLCQSTKITALDVAGISYGGDLALTYSAFSRRVRKIFASGTLGSFSVVFSHCYNAPAHCIPGVLKWMDRSDIAGLNAPRPLTVHYGELDTPGPKNSSASYNESVGEAVAELKKIYRAFNAQDAVSLVVTPGKGHEMDNGVLKSFLST